MPESVSVELDIKSLFNSDVESLSQPELTCLKIIASKAPADWSEIIEISGVSTLNSLIHRRLVVRSGDRLNIYWDIFRDYLITGSTPVIPFKYIPTTDFTSFMKVASELNRTSYVSFQTLGDLTNLSERTILNIGADLVMFGVAERKNFELKLSPEIESANEFNVLTRLRGIFCNHSVKIDLYKQYAGSTVDQETIFKVLKASLPKAKYNEKTWNTYAARLAKFLVLTGFLHQAGSKWIVKDLNSPIENRNNLVRHRKGGDVFSALSSPYSVCEALNFLINNPGINVKNVQQAGHRNALATLTRFGLTTNQRGFIFINNALVNKSGGITEAIWTAAKNEPTLIKCVELLKKSHSSTAYELGKYISDLFRMNWKEASIQRNGGGYRQWSRWVIVGESQSSIPEPPSRKNGPSNLLHSTGSLF